jgi:excisionase family DNA binding protein
MDLKEAADFLSISTRQVENYAAQGMLTRRKVKVGRTHKNLFDRDELDRLKARLSAEIVTPSLDVPQHPEATALQRPEMVRNLVAEGEALALLQRIADALGNARTVTMPDTFAETLGRTVADEVRKLRLPVADLAHKLTLTTTDAAVLSGLPLSQIRTALRTGALPSIGRGRSRRVKRADLDAWVAGL